MTTTPTTITLRAIYLEPKQQLRRGQPARSLYRDGWGPVVVEVTDNHGDERFTPGQRYSFSGEYRPGDFIKGLEYQFSGRYDCYRPEKGKVEHQLRWNGFARPTDRPPTDGESLSYLASCPVLSVKPAAVRDLFDFYGHDAVTRIITDPQAVYAELSRRNTRLRIHIETLTAAADYFRAREQMRAVYEEVTALLKGHGFPKAMTDAVITQWGVAAAARIRRHPFALLRNFSGAGFAKCDALYMALKLPPDKLRRQALAVWSAVAESDDGDTWVPATIARQTIREKISGVTKLRPEAAVRLAVRFGLLAIYTDDAGREWIADARKAAEEHELAELIVEAMDEPNPWAAILNHPQAATRLDPLSEHQRSELLSALTSPVAGLTGGPGTGKTYTVAALVKLCLDVYPEEGAVQITALAGKAAQRSTESLQPYGVDLRARTTHSLLRVKRFGGKSEADEFEFCRAKRLPAKVLFVDEFSLDNTTLALALFRARAPGTAVLLIGDKGQLLPIGHGAPLRDFEQAGIPFARLTETHRNAGTIVRVCEKIGRGERLSSADFDSVDRLAPDLPEHPRNLAFLHASTPEQAAARVVEALTVIRDKFAADPIWECQVIVARNGDKDEPSPVSRIALNRLLQETFNSDGERIGETKYRIGDKCIQLENARVPLAGEGDVAGGDGAIGETTGETEVSNGEFCKIIAANDKGTKLTLRFSAPDRTVTADHNSAIDLGNAATCHKMQGSQEQWCVYVVDWMYGITREHPFTGVSRCVRGGFMVGSMQTLNRIICPNPNNKNSGSGIKRRKTFLRELIEAGRLWGERVWWEAKNETASV